MAHIIDLYYIDREAPMRICPRLTEQHVISGNINNMKVKSCTQVFSYTEASHLVTFSKWNKKYSSELVPLLDSLSDSCNSSSKTAPEFKPLLEALSLSSQHVEFWSRAIICLNSAKFYCPVKKVFVTVPSIKNLIATLRGFISLKKSILSKFKNNYICLRNLNQDSSENFWTY